MRIRSLLAIPVLLATTAPAAYGTALAPTPQDIVDLGWSTYEEGDPENADFVLSTLTEEAGVELSVAPTCVAGSTERDAHIVYRDAAGQKTFGFFSTISYAWDCKRVTRISNPTHGEVYQPQYTFSGYVHRNVSPAGQRVASASAQGRFGICQQVVGETCALERTPTIAWKVYANGQATPKMTP